MTLSLAAAGPSGLAIFWFALIGVLWTGYFFLEGFDFGVGVLMPFVSKDDLDRRVLVNAIGPTWDGNEVWLLTAGGATFAAFPLWYATVFSGFYLALFLILVALIARGMAFEFRGKRDSVKWRFWWDQAIFFGSLLPALLWGVAFADFLHGVPIGPHGTWVNGFFQLVKPYALLGGLTSLSLFTLHGATFLGLKTTGGVRDRTRGAAKLLAPITFVIALLFFGWTYLTATHSHHTGLVPPFLPIVALVILAGVAWLVRDELEGWAFTATGLVIAMFTATIFLALYPRVLVSSISPIYNLTIANTASQHYTLVAMTIVALIFTPFVLVYQAWSYWIFRKRVTGPVVGEVDAGGPPDAPVVAPAATDA
jgi:cytochrome d ubiquinol oxidase subunit II